MGKSKKIFERETKLIIIKFAFYIAILATIDYFQKASLKTNFLK